jgi:hypothetical protein
MIKFRLLRDLCTFISRQFQKWGKISIGVLESKRYFCKIQNSACTLPVALLTPLVFVDEFAFKYWLKI